MLPSHPATQAQPRWRRWKEKRDLQPWKQPWAYRVKGEGYHSGCTQLCVCGPPGPAALRPFSPGRSGQQGVGYRALRGPRGAVSLGVTQKPRPRGWCGFGGSDSKAFPEPRGGGRAALTVSVGHKLVKLTRDWLPLTLGEPLPCPPALSSVPRSCPPGRTRDRLRG